MSLTSTAVERFWSKASEGPGGCWLWTAHKNPAGYGMFTVRTRKKVPAHRWAYEYLRGDIPEGLDLDHLCRVRHCVNPWHLEPVTHAENMARGRWATSTHCAKGHAFDEANTYRRPSGARTCRACNRAAVARYQDKGNA